MVEDSAANSKMSGVFRRYAADQFAGYSPLYERLALGIADDTQMLDFIGEVGRGRAVLPLLFLGAVHYLLLKGIQHPLASYYPSVEGYDKPLQSGDPYPAFSDFCRQYRGEIGILVRTRIVQTNEVQRCACLLPAFTLIARQVEGKPLALVELGASAGLNLLWDKYGYSYSDGRRCGDPASPVQLTCELRGEYRPSLPAEMPTIAYRVGIDLNPIAVHDPDQMLWLRALIWPEHRERAELQAQAISVVEAEPPPIVAGDLLEQLPAVMQAAPQAANLIVFHSFTLNQLAPPDRARLDQLFVERGRVATLYRIAYEWLRSDTPQITISRYAGTANNEQLVAKCHPHGQWLEWLLPTKQPGEKP